MCVLGTGLIGGSLLRAAAGAGFDAWGYNRSEPGAQAARADGFDVTGDLLGVLTRAADTDATIVVAVPMPAVDHILTEVSAFAPRCTLTDVVSVKAPVAAAVHKHGLSARYVGGHPMAGTSESGWAATDPGLFRGAAWAVGVDEGTHPEPWTRVVRLALACGSVVVPVVADEHDSAVARISHLPHVLAEALAIAGDGGGELALGLAAGSFRDGTRVAGTAPGLVRAICEPNSRRCSPRWTSRSRCSPPPATACARQDRLRISSTPGSRHGSATKRRNAGRSPVSTLASRTGWGSCAKLVGAVALSPVWTDDRSPGRSRCWLMHRMLRAESSTASSVQLD